MMTLEQLEANRRNAQKSTGPVTPEGKAASSKNALKFGFCSSDPLYPGEDPAAFVEFRRELFDSLRPVGKIEERLANRIVNASWRLDRFPAAEAQALESQMIAGFAEQSLKEAARLNNPSRISWEESTDPEACREALENEAEAQRRLASPEMALGRALVRDAQDAGTLAALCRYE